MQCSAIRHLYIALPLRCMRRYWPNEVQAADVAALSGVLSCTEASLQCISIEGIRFTAVQWKDIAQALESNTELHMLTLKECDFDNVPEITYPWHPFKNIHQLELLDCRWYNEWSNESFPSLSDYLPLAVHLCRLTLQVRTNDKSSRLHVHVPDEFMVALRKNGSLRDVSVGTSYPDRLPLPHVVRYMQAIAERNRQLPEILGRVANSGNSANGYSGGADPTSRSSRVVLIPMLFHLACQAPRMAPNTLFHGLLSTTFDEIGPIALHCKRRIE
jgi:hypothetical protein